jgi:hypothetical protein
MYTEVSRKHEVREHLEKSKTHYDRRPVGQCILVSNPVRGSWPDVNYCLTVTVLLISDAPSAKPGPAVYKASLRTVFRCSLLFSSQRSLNCMLYTMSYGWVNINNEFERMWKKAIMVCFKIFFHRHRVNLESRLASRKSKLRPTEHEEIMITIIPKPLVSYCHNDSLLTQWHCVSIFACIIYYVTVSSLHLRIDNSLTILVR